MLLPIAASIDPGGPAAPVQAPFLDAIHPIARIEPPSVGVQHKPDEDPAVEIAIRHQAGGVPAGDRGGPAHDPRLARWAPVVQAMADAELAVVGFLRAMGVPASDAEDMARRVSGAARERISAVPQATADHYESGRLSLTLHDVHVGFDASEDAIRIGKAEIGIDETLPGAPREPSGTSLGGAEAEIGGRRVAFEYKGPGQTGTPAYADRGASGVTFTVNAPVAPPAAAPAVSSGHVDVAI
jgi:hypothetical protein